MVYRANNLFTVGGSKGGRGENVDRGEKGITERGENREEDEMRKGVYGDGRRQENE